jgi:hypothetical protein
MRPGLPIAYDDENAQIGDLSLHFAPCVDDQVQAMTSAVWADGWKQAGVSHGVNVRKGPSFFSGARDTTGATW